MFNDTSTLGVIFTLSLGEELVDESKEANNE